MSEALETESAEAPLSPSSITIASGSTDTDLNPANNNPQREGEATYHEIRHCSIDERFFNAPLVVPIKVILNPE